MQHAIYCVYRKSAQCFVKDENRMDFISFFSRPLSSVFCAVHVVAGDCTPHRTNTHTHTLLRPQRDRCLQNIFLTFLCLRPFASQRTLSSRAVRTASDSFFFVSFHCCDAVMHSCIASIVGHFCHGSSDPAFACLIFEMRFACPE